MKTLLKATAVAAALAAGALMIAPTQAAVSVSIGQPGFFGQIDIGGAPPPALWSPRPVLVAPAPPGLAPVYLHVPPGYERHWERHCREYNACARPVYFVKDDWYRNVYVPHYHDHHEHFERDHRDDRRDFDRDHRDDRRDGRRDDRRDDRRDVHESDYHDGR